MIKKTNKPLGLIILIIGAAGSIIAIFLLINMIISLKGLFSNENPMKINSIFFIGLKWILLEVIFCAIAFAGYTCGFKLLGHYHEDNEETV